MGGNSDVRRRRSDVDQNELRRLERSSWQNETKIEFGSADYVELVKAKLEIYQKERRRSSGDVPEISSSMWKQCAGYAVATARVISHLHHHGAADIMATNLRGNADERVE